MKLVLDATPIIHAAKTRLHALLDGLEVELFTTPSVEREVLAGELAEERGVLELLFKKEIRVEKSKGSIKARGLHAGEASVLALAKEKKAVLVSDDRVARTVAKAMGITVVHSTFLIFRALEKKVVGRQQAEDLVEELVESGWWCDAETLARVYNAIRKYG